MQDKKSLQNKILIYTDKKGNVELKADVEKETIWATQAQIAELFDTTPQNITIHLGKIFDEEELNKRATCKESLQVQTEGNRSVKRSIEHYNLDAIIAVGYRINSKKATQFRIWATRTLREYIVKGFVANMDRIQKVPDRILLDLDQKLAFIKDTIRRRELNQVEVNGLLSVIKDYAHSWQLLKLYDEGELKLERSKAKERKKFSYEIVRPAIDALKTALVSKEEATDIFGNERDESFKGILGNIYQTFGGKELYVSLEEKAAHLLYFVIKDHPFSDGNKRIGSFLFIHFLNENKILTRSNGEKKIQDTTLVALALLIAESDPNQKEVMVALVTNLLV